MADYLDAAKNLAQNYRTWARNSVAKGDISMAARQTKNGEMLDALVAEVEELRRVTKPVPVSYGDLSDLPPELLKELTGTKVDESEQQLFNIIKAGGKEVELDTILIELFRRYNVIQTRKFLQNKLWRMAQKGIIISVQGRKGVYCAPGAMDVPEVPTNGGFPDELDDDVPF